ncbi:MAG: hypothetical protein ACI4J0_06470 [Huintestinicola sp.]|uniref:hypothetical protein n=1 Tax=Huintestinicola sp. TaxID=2981661 RepID=UPI003F088EBF
MVYSNPVFYRRIDKNEKKGLDKSGNIQTHNGAICRNFENTASYDNAAECDDEFFRKLKYAVKKNELSRSPLLPSVIMDVFALLFVLICLSFGFKISQILVFISLPAAVFCYFTYSIIRESIRLHRVMKCVKQRENIRAVSFRIDGTRLFTDNSGDDSKDYFYVCSGPVLICVPKEIYDISGPDRSLIGAVVGKGRHRMFYALYVI